jgi:peptidoglycan/xylan/chitin deacetylase (PgdA/CDA1 family)
MFHGVIDSLSEHAVFGGSRNCFVRTEDFEHAIEYCSKRYRILKQEDLDTYFNGTASEDGIFISVDDGLQNFVDNGIPILQKYKAPATVFITSDWTNQGKEPAIFSLEYHLFYHLPATITISHGKFLYKQMVDHKKQLPGVLAGIWNNLFAEKISPNGIQAHEITINGRSMDSFPSQDNPAYWKPASWESLRSACQDGIIQIGGHGKTHTPWSWLSANELEKEFIENSEQIRLHLNVPVSTCTFPFGMYDEKTLDTVGKHYTYGFTNRVLANGNKLNLSCMSRYNVPFQKPNNIPSLISYPLIGKILRKVGGMTKLF